MGMIELPSTECAANPRLNVNIAGLSLANPVATASGCFGFGLEMAEYYDLNLLGAISVKGTTLNPRFGNPTPRVAECSAGMLNSVGLQNPGADAVAAHELPALRKLYSGTVLANISGFSIPEYTAAVERIQACGYADAIELNISCPNVHGGGMSFGTDPRAAADVTGAVRDICRMPLIVKLTPNVTDIAAIAKAVEDAGADALCVANTFLGMRIDINRRRPVTSRPTAGYSGPAVFPMALRCVWQTAAAVNIPIIGCGGVESAEDVLEMMMAGATAVEIGTASLIDPYAAPKAVAALPALLNRLGIDKISDIIGCVKQTP